MIHYHGTPITPRATLLRLGGRSFCVSFGDPRDIIPCHEIGESVMLDNGAYMAWTRGHKLNWMEYYKWCEAWLEYRTTWAVIPDVIDGTSEENDRLIDQWPHGDRGAPVWHLHESLDRLRTLCVMWPRVCFGSSGAFSTVGTDAWHRRIIAAFNAIAPNGRVPVWVHMMRGLAFCGSQYPFASADSTNIAKHHKEPNNGIEMVHDIDTRQCPGRWKPQPEQERLCID
jgi:hypothetical protein